MKIERSSRGGQALLMVALGSTFLLALGSLAIDAMWTYLAKAQLDTAVEATALGLSRSSSDDADEIADRLFEANIERGLYSGGEGPRMVSVSLGAVVQVEAEAQLPTLFSRVFTEGGILLRSSARARRRGGRIAFVFERAESTLDPGMWSAFEREAGRFLSIFSPESAQLGVISFGVDASVEQDWTPANGEAWARDGFSGFGAQEESSNLALGLYRALSLHAAAAPAPAGAIVFVTSSPPNAYSAGQGVVVDCDTDGPLDPWRPAVGLTYPVTGVHAGTGDPSSQMMERSLDSQCEAVHWASIHQAIAVANHARAVVPNLRIYGIGLGQGFENWDLDALEDLTNAATARYPDPTRGAGEGAFVAASDPSELSQAFSRIRDELSRVGL